ncbi:MAG: hypothetical protein EZS28_018925 [Streblomastix strix]|uniref:Uncharacterized protein n=1 Tax=Streblomastix strix TaxID=222440 RepID=A0A5J4VSJ3_9EUKA|nr:MAG: hypothetical protein EZS28_018925 [Streblomastix strix]
MLLIKFSISSTPLISPAVGSISTLLGGQASTISPAKQSVLAMTPLVDSNHIQQTQKRGRGRPKKVNEAPTISQIPDSSISSTPLISPAIGSISTLLGGQASTFSPATQSVLATTEQNVNVQENDQSDEKDETWGKSLQKKVELFSTKTILKEEQFSLNLVYFNHQHSQYQQ